MSNPSNPNRAGGAATGGGMNFQAAVTAIAYVYMLRGQPLTWLEKVTQDIPVAVYAETGGAGDDIRLDLKSGEIVEVQVKKGLQSGNKLWNSLTTLAQAIQAKTVAYGVLIVSPTSSNTIKEQLARDITRLGDGRDDNLSAIATQFVEKLNALNLPVSASCQRIRIHTVNALPDNQADIRAVRSELAHLCADAEQINSAWNSLYKDADDLIAQRGRREVSSILRLLHTQDIQLATNNTTAPMLLLEKLNNWTFTTHAYFSIFGIQEKLPTDEVWIPLEAIVQEQPKTTDDLAQALKKYQAWEFRAFNSDAEKVNPETLARFIPRVVLIGGPGMGKTTLLKRIARRYSEDRIPVLQVKLIKVMPLMQQAGSSFEEAVFDLGLDSSGITPTAARQAAFPNWLLLCDGLDECGRQQEEVAAGVARFAAGHPDCRVLVTTRPVGYETAHFSDWRHYEIAPLESSSATSHLAKLVAASAPEGSPLQDEQQARDLCSAELEHDETQEVIARNPLLLGLAASILVRGGHLGTSKEHLFEQIFALIDDVPNARIQEPPAAAIVLQRFLDILGWHITATPLNPIKKTLEQCAVELARETGDRPLKAHADAESYLRYWQDVGMIERIGQGYEETLSFIHKSFGEFAAARHLCAMPSKEQHNAIQEIIDTAEWAEVIRFAALLGLADEISEILLSENATENQSVKRIIFAVELIAAANPPPQPDLRQQIIAKAFNIVCSERRLHAFEIGKQLVAAARRFPEEVGQPASQLLNHEQGWTYLVAWATAVVSGKKYHSSENLAEVLQTCSDITNLNMSLSIQNGGLFSLQHEFYLFKSIFEKFIPILIKEDISLAEGLTQSILDKPFLTGLVDTAISIFKAKNKYKFAEKLSKKYNTFKSIEYALEGLRERNEAELIACEAIFDALELSNATNIDDYPSKPLLHFSAFLQEIRFGKIHGLFPDFWAWNKPFDKKSTHEVFKTLISLSKVDPEKLRKEAQLARAYLQNPSFSVFSLYSDIDIPEVDWTKASSLDFDKKLIEKALYHPSLWVAWIAANLLENAVSEKKLEPIISELFRNGEGNSLIVAYAWSDKLTPKQIRLLIFERLSQSLTHGCQYFYKLLQKIKIQWSNDLSNILRQGLQADVEIAVEAAQLAVNIAKPNQTDLENIIIIALAYWLEHEKPSPTKGGTIPPSPRANLLEALIKIRPLSYNELKQYTADSRSDVQDIAKENFITWLQSPNSPRLQFFNEIGTEEIASHLLGKALKAMYPLNTEELIVWEALLKHQNSSIRFNAMALLHPDYLDSAFVGKQAQAMLKDDEQQIRDRAYRILDNLEANDEPA